MLSMDDDKDDRLSKKPVFVKKCRSVEAVEGDDVSILCEVIGDPKPDVTFQRDFLNPDYYLHSERLLRVGDGPQYRLRLACVKLEDTGCYTIQAKNEYGDATAAVSLQVFAKGQGKEEAMSYLKKNNAASFHTLPLVVQPLQDMYCSERDAVTFECHIESEPAPMVRWEHKGTVLEPGSDFKQEVVGQVVKLHIANVYPEDEGTYTCVAYTDSGKAESKAFLTVTLADDKENDVTVQLGGTEDRPAILRGRRSTSRACSAPVGSPPPMRRRRDPDREHKTKFKKKLQSPKFYSIPHNKICEVGDKARFSCSIAGHPTPDVTWDKDGTTIYPEHDKYTIEEKDDFYVLEIHDVQNRDAGLYRVTVENCVGRIQHSAKLDIIISGISGL